MPIFSKRIREPVSWGTATPALALEDYIDTLVEEKLKKLLQGKVALPARKLKDAEAKKEVIGFIVKQGREGIHQLGILDISVALGLPAIQVEKVMGYLEGKKLVREIHG